MYAVVTDEEDQDKIFMSHNQSEMGHFLSQGWKENGFTNVIIVIIYIIMDNQPS